MEERRAHGAKPTPDIGIHIYDLHRLADEFDFGECRVSEFVEAAHTEDVLEARRVGNGLEVFLCWTYGVPSAISYQTLHERWLKLPDEERRRLEEVLEVLGKHKIDTWVIA